MKDRCVQPPNATRSKQSRRPSPSHAPGGAAHSYYYSTTEHLVLPLPACIFVLAATAGATCIWKRGIPHSTCVNACIHARMHVQLVVVVCILLQLPLVTYYYDPLVAEKAAQLLLTCM